MGALARGARRQPLDIYFVFAFSVFKKGLGNGRANALYIEKGMKT
jgi:hypothetical protein